MALYQTLLLVCCVSLAIGLSLDNLSHRVDVPSSHHFSDAQSDEDFDFVNPSKRKSETYEPSSFSSFRGNNFWDKNYPIISNFREQVKREISDNEKHLTDILKDDDSDKPRDKKIAPDAKKDKPTSKKKKRESKEPMDLGTTESTTETAPEDQDNPDFQDWLRREYYRNMAKSFASMRRKRAMWGPVDDQEKKRVERRSVPSQSRQKKEVRFEEVTDNLKTIEDALLADALRVIKENGDLDEDDRARHRLNNDLNAAYDIETMRAALFRLRNTLYNMEDDNNAVDSREFSHSYKKRKRGDDCPPLRVLSSDCAALGDIVPDDSLKELLSRACNWHEVCYTCGEVFGLSSENCDVGFVEQSRTICRGDVPCETTAQLLLLPLRQRRVFYKRSNPSICLVDPCVEEFLSKGQ